MRTFTAKPGEIDRKWVCIDAQGLVLGRLAVEVARRLMGKHRPEFTPHVDTGDYVIVTNADKVVISGKKLDQRKIQTYSGYPGGLKEESLRRLMGRAPEKVFRLAVRRMLPKTRLGRQMLKKLKVYAGAEHPHEAQQPEPIQVEHARRG